ncbi:acetylcholine receptor subunit gamma-like [Pararge aegeria]|uniref:acetylcholine receptor subunit gamma-like n=1 Tax=Pararge aegeria TaxID=116150 RepID=UPI0019D0E667|nr:acetylcholine receptor subunit gamma-like [Pararge aegeria]
MITMLVIILTLVSLIDVTINSAIDNRSTDIKAEQRLRSDLLKDYISYKPPSADTTTVQIKFILKHFSFNEEDDNFEMSTWVFLEWQDSRLAWKPEDYSNIDETKIRSMFIWRPSCSFKNVDQLNDDANTEWVKPSAVCKLMSEGNVTCALQLYHQTNCEAKLNNWPYDTKNCTFIFIARRSVPIHSEQHHRVKFSFPPEKTALNSLTYGPGWDLIDYNSSITQINGTSIQFNFVFQRQALGFVTIVIIPSLATAAFTLCSVFLDFRCYIRIVMISFSLLIHFSLLEIMSVFLPFHEVATPFILLFNCASIIVTTCVILLTVTLNMLLRMQITSASKIVSFNESVLGTSLKYFIVPKWKVISTGETEYSINNAEIRINLASIVNSLFLYVFLVVYLILYCVLMPQPEGFKQ